MMYNIARQFSRFITKILYRTKYEGLDQIPLDGAAIIAPNHVSYMDALLMARVSKRKMRFVMWYKIYNKPLLKPIFKALGVIPIASPRESMEVFKGAFKMISEALSNGELLVFFPEGEITRNGELQEIKGGIEYILKDNPVPVIPVSINGLYGSHFSRAKNKPFFGKWMAKVSVIVGDAMDATSVDRRTLHKALHDVSAENV